MGGSITLHWAHRYRSTTIGDPNSKTPANGRLFKYLCKGVIQCTNIEDECPFQIRPNVKSKSRFGEQLEKLCPNCQSPLTPRPCSVVCEVRKWEKGLWLRNIGTHSHDQPEQTLHLLPQEREKLREFVNNHPNVTPLQAVVGVQTLTGTGESVAEISPVLANPARYAHEAREIVNTEVGPGGDKFLRAYSNFKAEYEGFIRRAVFAEDGVTVICVQTAFMRSQLVHENDIDEPVNGIVTDGAHKFFQDAQAILIVSSTFSIFASRWFPGLESYSNGATSAHYRVHFLELFISIEEEAQSRSLDVVDGLFAGVSDYVPLLKPPSHRTILT